jgi:phytoene dehydrogenase-like protein
VGAPGGVRAHRVVRGGVGGLAAALVKAAGAYGAEIRTGAEVERIIIRDGRATGVALRGGEVIAAATIVSAADPHRTLADLLDPVHLDPELSREVDNIKLRGASARVHLTLGERPRFQGLDGTAGAADPLGAILTFAPTMDDIERAYDAAKHGGTSERPLLEATIPTVHDASMAPPGRHVMSVRVQYAPYHLSGGAWTAERRDALGDLVIRTLGEYAPGLPGSVIDRAVFTPADLESRFGLSEGSVTHGEMTLDQILFMRPVPAAARYRAPVPDLYLCGMGTHPGGGLAGASGWLAAREIVKDLKHGRLASA